MPASLRARRAGPVVMLLALTLVHGLIYLSVIPPWQAPDEPFHFLSAESAILLGTPDAAARWQQLKSEAADSLVQFRFWELVIHVQAFSTPEEIQRNLPRGFESAGPLVPRAFTYTMLALPLRLVTGQPVALQLYWARLFSVLVNLGVVWIAYEVGRLLFAGDPFGSWLLPLAIVFLPQHTFILAAVSDGNPAELWAAAAMYFCVRGIVRGARWQELAAFCIFSALAVASKPTTFFLVPIFLIFLGGYGWRKLPGWWRMLVPGAAAALVAGLAALSERFRTSLSLIQSVLTPAGAGMNGWDTGRVVSATFETFRGFWAWLGWTSLPVSDPALFALLALTLAALGGLIKLAWRGWRSRRRAWPVGALGQVMLVFFACIGMSLASMGAVFVYSGYQYGLYESRYLFAAIIPIMGALVTGWREWVPAGWRREGLAVMASAFFLFDAVILLDYAIPFFYPVWR